MTSLLVRSSLVALSIPIMIYVYVPVWSQPRKWIGPNHIARFQWLGHELTVSLIRTTILAAFAYWAAQIAVWTDNPARRARLATLIPLLVLADLLGAHFFDVPTIDPRYWTKPPESVRRLKADPGLIRVWGRGDKDAGEPGYASEPIDFFAVRDSLDWSLPSVWNLNASKWHTPMISRRLLRFTEHAAGRNRFDIESDTHIVLGRLVTIQLLKHRMVDGPGTRVGTTSIHRNQGGLPRVRLAGSPVYASDENQAIAQLDRLEANLRNYLVVEDPTHPLPTASAVLGTAQIVEEIPDRVVVEADAATPAYLVLSDTFDPGWSATVDGQPAPIPRGKIVVPRGAPEAVAVIETARSKSGTLTLRGPMVPTQPFPPGVEQGSEERVAPDGLFDTGYACRIARDRGTIVLTAPPAGITATGFYRFRQSEVDDAVAAIDPAAVIVAVPDALLGQRLAGSARDGAAITSELEGLGVNALIAGAFRPRGIAA